MTFSISRLSQGVALLAGSALLGGLAQAQPSSAVVARVVSATPQWQQVPVQVCDPARAAPTGGGAAVGALAGGAIGSQMGSGNGHIAGAILGAIGGAMAGNAIEAQNRAVTGAGCGTQYQNQITGYDVIYEWGGHQYHTQTTADPGQWVRVASPVGNGSYAEPAYANAQQQQPAYAPPPAVGTQVAPPPPPPGYAAYPAQAYPAYPVYSPQPVYARPVYPAVVYPAPVLAPAPVYVGPPVGVSIGVGGGWRRGGWGVGVGF